MTDYTLRFAENEDNARILRENLLSDKFCVDSRHQKDPARNEEFLIKTLGFLDDHSGMEEIPSGDVVLFAVDRTVEDRDKLTFLICDPARYTSLREIGRYFAQTPPVQIPRIWFNQEGHFYTNGTDYWSFLSGKVSFLIGICQGAEYGDYENIRFLLPDEGFLSAIGRAVSVGKLRAVDSSLMELYLSDLLYSYAGTMNCLVRRNGLGGEKVYHIFSKNYLRVGYIDSLRYIREFFEKDGIGTRIRAWKCESNRTCIDMELSWKLTPNIEKFGYRPGVRLVLSDTGAYGLGMSAILFTESGAAVCAGSKKTACLSVKRNNHKVPGEENGLTPEIIEEKGRMQVYDLYKDFRATERRKITPKVFMAAEKFFSQAVTSPGVFVDAARAYSSRKSDISLTTPVGTKLSPIMGRVLAPCTLKQKKTWALAERSARSREKVRDKVPDCIDSPAAVRLYREGTDQIRSALEAIFGDEWTEPAEAQAFCEKVLPFFDRGVPAAACMLLQNFDSLTLRPRGCPEKDREFDKAFWDLADQLLTPSGVYRPDLVRVLIEEKARGTHYLRAAQLVRDHMSDERLALGSEGREAAASWPQVVRALFVYAEEFTDCGTILQDSVMQSLGAAFEADFTKLSDKFAL